MSIQEPKVPQYTLEEKLNVLTNLRMDIKKKRLVIDENKDKFGFDDLTQLVKVKNTSEVKGYPFKARKASLKSNIDIGIKIVPIETKYDKHEHPCNIENIILRELSENIVSKGISPHIAFYLGTQKVGNKCRALKMLNLKRLEVEGKIRTHSNMLLSEFVDGGSLDTWVFNTYENDGSISDEQWKHIAFQLIYTIAIIQKYYKMMHNDFHYGNILIDNTIKPEGYFVYEVNGKKYYLKNTGMIPKLWDFEFAMVYSDKIKESYPNKFIIGPYEYDRKKHYTDVVRRDDDTDDFNVPYNYNQVYDLHYFLTSLLDLYISQELFDWIIDTYPQELIPEDADSTSSSRLKSTKGTDTVSKEKSKESDSISRLHSTDSDTTTHSASEYNNTSEISSELSSWTTNSVESTKSEDRYLKDGRLKNGMEEVFDLPTPMTLLESKFFEQYLIKPSDFDESKAMYFKAGF